MSKKIKKIIPYLLILIILVGLFSPMVRVNAEELSPAPTQQEIEQARAATDARLRTEAGAAEVARQAAASKKSDFEQQFDTATVCYTGLSNGIINVGGCLVVISYYLFYVVPSWLLALSANFFNALVAITLSSALFAKSFFVSTAWAVVRDLTNIFFILILLYIAIQTILGIGHETKKMIVKVVIMALLINFSMFFTQVVIDTSNILALVFYNKLDVNAKNADGSIIRNYTPITKEKTDKDLSGAMVKAFNPTSQLTMENFFNAARQPPVGGKGAEEKGTCTVWPVTRGGFYTRAECAAFALGGTWKSVETNPTGQLLQVPPGIMLGLILVTGAIMLFAAYAFFIAGISFLGRLIELWILIIFSPFAFMSSTVPKFAGVEYLGWDAWFKRLISTSFMAPIFMFFMFLIFMLINAKLFDNLIVGTGMVETMLLLIIPAMVILLLLMKATKFAKEGGGQFAEMAMKGIKMAGGMVGGLALGAATGGAAIAGRAVIGGGGGALAGKLAQGADKMGATKWGGRMGFNKVGSGLRDIKSFAQKSSFDVRNAPGVGALAKASGINMGTPIKSYTEARAEKVKKRQARAEELKVGEDEELKQNLNTLERDHQELLQTYSHDIEMLDKRIKSAREASKDLASKANLDGATQTDKDAAKEAADKLEELKANKKAIKNGTDFTETVLTATPGTAARGTVSYASAKKNGRSINDLEDHDIPDAEHEIKRESDKRKWRYAERIEGGRLTFWRRTSTNREAADRIRRGAQIPSSGGSEGEHH